MRSGNIAKLVALIRQYGLDNIDEVRWWLSLIELGEMDEGLAGMCLYQCQAYAEERRQRPNFLAPPPTYEELYPDGEDPPDLILGHLVDRPEVPIGLYLEDALHGVVAGAPKTGKSCALRRIIVIVFPSAESVVSARHRRDERTTARATRSAVYCVSAIRVGLASTVAADSKNAVLVELGATDSTSTPISRSSMRSPVDRALSAALVAL